MSSVHRFSTAPSEQAKHLDMQAAKTELYRQMTYDPTRGASDAVAPLPSPPPSPKPSNKADEGAPKEEVLSLLYCNSPW